MAVASLAFLLVTLGIVVAAAGKRTSYEGEAFYGWGPTCRLVGQRCGEPNRPCCSGLICGADSVCVRPMPVGTGTSCLPNNSFCSPNGNNSKCCTGYCQHGTCQTLGAGQAGCVSHLEVCSTTAVTNPCCGGFVCRDDGTGVSKCRMRPSCKPKGAVCTPGLSNCCFPNSCVDIPEPTGVPPFVGYRCCPNTTDPSCGGAF